MASQTELLTLKLFFLIFRDRKSMRKKLLELEFLELLTQDFQRK